VDRENDTCISKAIFGTRSHREKKIGRLVVNGKKKKKSKILDIIKLKLIIKKKKKREEFNLNKVI